MRVLKTVLMPIFFAIILTLTTITVVKAETKSTKDKINEAAKVLEDIFNSQYQELLEQTKTTIKENGYDYELTMQTFYEWGNPFKDMDYNDLIAAYVTVKQYNTYYSRPMEDFLASAHFLEYDLTEEKYTEEDGTITRYGMVTIHPRTAAYLFEYFGIDQDAEIKGKTVSELYKDNKKAIEDILNGIDINQNIFVEVRKEVDDLANSQEFKDYFYSIKTSPERLRVINTAMTLRGQVPYQWGGKAEKPGYDTSWWTYNAANTQRGLDCSGYVQWVFMTAGFDEETVSHLISTATTNKHFRHIPKVDLLPGDLALLNNGETINHVAIYLGDGYWIHNSSAKGTVAVTDDIGFRYFLRVVDDETPTEYRNNKETIATVTSEEYTESVLGVPYVDSAKEEPEQEEPKQKELEVAEAPVEETEEEYIAEVQVDPFATNTNVDEADVLLLAQLIHHEALNQGMNGWVAVGEVVMNRVNHEHPDFPDTIRGVILQPGQFTGSSSLSRIQPNEEIMSVARQCIEGKIHVLNNPNALFFRNPMITSGIRSTAQKDWGTYKWYMAIGEHAFYVME